MLTNAEIAACERLIAMALEEDLANVGDLTSQVTIPSELQGQAVFVARSNGVLAGLPIIPLVCAQVDTHIAYQPLVEDGAKLTRGTRLATISWPDAWHFGCRANGPQLSAAPERCCHVDASLCGCRGELPTKILDTRKTTPGYRLLEKYAVRVRRWAQSPHGSL